MGSTTRHWQKTSTSASAGSFGSGNGVAPAPLASSTIAGSGFAVLTRMSQPLDGRFAAAGLHTSTATVAGGALPTPNAALPSGQPASYADTEAVVPRSRT